VLLSTIFREIQFVSTLYYTIFFIKLECRLVGIEYSTRENFWRHRLLCVMLACW